MKAILVLFAVGSAAAAGYIAGDAGEVDVSVGIVAVVGLLALVVAWAIPAGEAAKTVSLRPARTIPAAGADRRVLKPGEMARLREQERLLAAGNPVAVRLVQSGRNKIAVIKVLRNYLDLGLKEAKTLADEAQRGTPPLVIAEMAVERARLFARDIEAAGGVLDFEEPATR